MERLLSRGNDKVGEGIHVFSLPAVTTCPGLTGTCKKHCYARRNRYRFRKVRANLARCLKAAKADNFADRMSREIAERGATVVRIHGSGDFFSRAYAEAWAEIARACDKVTFYAYTRSWRVEEIRPAVETLSALDNVHLWYSADRDSGMPPVIPPRVRVAWLQTEIDEAVPDGVTLVFRPSNVRKEIGGRVPLDTICPTERPTPMETTCGGCQRCFRS